LLDRHHFGYQHHLLGAIPHTMHCTTCVSSCPPSFSDRIALICRGHVCSPTSLLRPTPSLHLFSCGLLYLPHRRSANVVSQEAALLSFIPKYNVILLLTGSLCRPLTYSMPQCATQNGDDTKVTAPRSISISIQWCK